jgi:hypothetical protein
MKLSDLGNSGYPVNVHPQFAPNLCDLEQHHDVEQSPVSDPPTTWRAWLEMNPVAPKYQSFSPSAQKSHANL